MSPYFRRVALIAASLGLLVSLFVALSPDDDDETAGPRTTATTTPSATTEPGTTTTEPAATTSAPSGPVRFRITVGGPIERGKVQLGREVVITATASVADEIHVHGYDLSADVAPGKPAEIEFDATIPGQFELELEDRGQLIAVLEVSP